MTYFTQLKAFIAKEISLEWREKQAINSILLYLTTTIFVCYLSFRFKETKIDPIVWNALFWIIILFTGINAVAKSFLQESQGRLIYYYTLISPQILIVAKMIYNALLMLVIGFLALLVYTVIMGNPVQDMLLFSLSIFLGAIGFSTTLTLVSGIASKVKNSSVMVAILGFPIILPMLLMLIKLSKNAMDGLALSASYDELMTLSALSTIVVAVSYILFPYLWRA